MVETEVQERRRKDPREDLVSALLAAEIEGERLSEIELIGFCVLLLVAGNETTTNLIANAVLCLDQHPAAAGALRSNPELLPGAIEEALRYRSPVQSMFRVTTEAVELSGKWFEASLNLGVALASSGETALARLPMMTASSASW